MVEIGVIAGEIGEAICLHDGDDQGVVVQQSRLLADGRASNNQVGRNRKYLNAVPRYFLDCRAELGQLLDLDSVLSAKIMGSPTR
jgi:hypothetical protein